MTTIQDQVNKWIREVKQEKFINEKNRNLQDKSKMYVFTQDEVDQCKIEIQDTKSKETKNGN